MYSYFLVFAQFGIIGAMVLLGEHLFASLSGIVVSGTALLFGLWTLAFNRLGNFNIRPDIKAHCIMVDSGPYRLVRHPMYLSVMGMMLGVVVASPSWMEIVLYVMLFAVLAAKARREERLWCDHHPEYAAYKARTKVFIPFIW